MPAKVTRQEPAKIVVAAPWGETDVNENGFALVETFRTLRLRSAAAAQQKRCANDRLQEPQKTGSI
jgi:hypothetical protein